MSYLNSLLEKISRIQNPLQVESDVAQPIEITQESFTPQIPGPQPGKVLVLSSLPSPKLVPPSVPYWAVSTVDGELYICDKVFRTALGQRARWVRITGGCICPFDDDMDVFGDGSASIYAPFTSDLKYFLKGVTLTPNISGFPPIEFEYGKGVVLQSTPIQLPSTSTLFNKDMTVAVWIKPTDYTPLGNFIYKSYLTDGPPYYHWDIRQDKLFRRFAVNVDYYLPGATTITVPTTASFVPGVWYYVVLTVSASQGAKFYVNGKFVQTVLTSVTLVTSKVRPGNIYLGPWINKGFRGFGLVGRFRGFERALTADEIALLFEAERAAYGI